MYCALLVTTSPSKPTSCKHSQLPSQLLLLSAYIPGVLGYCSEQSPKLITDVSNEPAVSISRIEFLICCVRMLHRKIQHPSSEQNFYQLTKLTTVIQRILLQPSSGCFVPCGNSMYRRFGRVSSIHLRKQNFRPSCKRQKHFEAIYCVYLHGGSAIYGSSRSQCFV